MLFVHAHDSMDVGSEGVSMSELKRLGFVSQLEFQFLSGKDWDR